MVSKNLSVCLSVCLSVTITAPSDDDGDDDSILSVCDEISSFGFYDNDDVKRHQKNDAVMTI